METEQLQSISEVNDEFRASGQGVTITSGVKALDDLYGLLQQVREYDDWGEGNDPYSEHDFGQFAWGNEKIFWKIDYYSHAGLRDWGDPLGVNCKRVMTVMLAEEY